MRFENIPDEDIPTANPADMIRQYEGWINRIVKRYSGLLADNGAIDIEDMVQAGNLAILEAQKTYKPSEGASFLSWSFRPIRNAILNLFGYDNPGRKRPPAPLVYLDEPINEESDESKLDMIQDPDCIIPEEKVVQDSAREEIQKEVREAVERMQNEKYKTVIKRIWFKGEDKQTISNEMGLSIDAVRQCDLNGRGKLSHDYRLKRLVMPAFNCGLTIFRTTMTSAVERAVLWKEKEYDLICGEGSFVAKDPECRNDGRILSWQ